MKEELKNALDIKKLAMVILGNTIYCIGVVAFILPLGLITGGTTGLGLIVNNFMEVPLEVFTAIFNVAMFMIAWFILGASFAITTMVSTFYYPAILGVFQKIEYFKSLTDDPLLGTICAGLLIGVGLGIVIRAGASTGGMDIPPLVLNKKMGLSVSVCLYAFDFAILLGQMMFRDSERSLYGIILVVIYTVVMDKVLVSGKGRIQVKIVSERYEEINDMIHEKLDRGTTFFLSETGYLRRDIKTLLTVVSKRQLVVLEQEVARIDPEAFVVVSEVKEVVGYGFTKRKVYK